MAKYPNAGWTLGGVDDPNEWVEELLELPQIGRLSMAILALRNLIEPMEAFLVPSDDESGAGYNEAAAPLAGRVDEDRPHVSRASVEPFSEITIVEPKGKGREVESTMQVDNEAGEVAAVEKTEPSIVVKRGKAHEKEPEPEDLEEFTEQGEPLVLNDPMVSFLLLIVCQFLFTRQTF
jgi:hypothetical protein